MGKTKEAAELLGRKLAESLGCPMELISYTYPEERLKSAVFSGNELVIWATPVYAGRIPNKTLDYVKSAIRGSETPAIPVVTYGNRSFDNALAELAGIMKENGCIPFAGAAVPAQHAFSKVLAKGKPSKEDYEELEAFAIRSAQKIKDNNISSIRVPGEEHPEKYYVPKKTDGSPAAFLKAKPVVDESRCCGCGACVNLCPMGSIQLDGLISVTAGTCIKCQACVRGCRMQARYFDNEEFLSHVKMLEENYMEAKKISFFE